MVAEHGSGRRGFLGSTRYELLDNPDVLIEVADWESAEAREAHMQEVAVSSPGRAERGRTAFRQERRPGPPLCIGSGDLRLKVRGAPLAFRGAPQYPHRDHRGSEGSAALRRRVTDASLASGAAPLLLHGGPSRG